MQQYRSGHWRCALGLTLLLQTLALPAAATDQLFSDTFEESKRFVADRPLRPVVTFVSAVLDPDRAAKDRRKRLRLNLEPLLTEVSGLLRAAGIPLRAYKDPSGARTVGFSTSFNLRDDLPAVSFHVGDRSPEPLGAFYSGRRRGLSWAFVWPFHRLTIRIEGGDDSEFGYFAIAGAQWTHPTLPLSAGIGVPVSLRNADGNAGIIFQFRSKLY